MIFETGQDITVRKMTGSKFFHRDDIKLSLSFIVFVLLIVLLPVVCAAEEAKTEDKVTGEIVLSILSAYVSRGQDLSRHSVVIQPAVTLNYQGFAVNYWGHLDTRPYSAANADYSARYWETDLTLSYTKKFGILQVTPGYIYYIYEAPNADAAAPLDSQEVFITLQLDTLLSPTFTIYKEIAHYNQWYLLLNISHTFQLSKIARLKLSAQASYLKADNAQTFPRYDGNALPTTDQYNNFHEGTLSLGLPIAVYKALIITPTIAYTFPLVDDARYAMKGRGLKGTADPSGRDSSFIYGGIVFNFTF